MIKGTTKPEAAYQKTKTPYVERVAPGHLQDDLGRSVCFAPGDMRPLDIAKPSGAISLTIGSTLVVRRILLER